MTDYTKATNFATKDALVTGDPLKVVKGTEIDDEFNAIEDAVETKANLDSPTFTGVPKAPTASTGTSTTQLATTAFVGDALDNFTISNNSVTSAMLQENSVTTRELNVADAGTSGQVLISDADGSFSWYSLPGSSSNPFISPSATDPTQRDDASALQEGDIYYNTADDELKAYDGSSWNNVDDPVLDLTAGASSGGTIPVGGHCIGSFDRDSFGNNEDRFSGYASTYSASASKYFEIAETLSRDGNGNFSTSETTIDYGTWKQMGGIGIGADGSPDAYAALFLVRTA